jgi:hypothetical protein
MATLQERLDEFKRTFESGAPPYNAPREAIETMHRATAELKASGAEDAALPLPARYVIDTSGIIRAEDVNATTPFVPNLPTRLSSWKH